VSDDRTILIKRYGSMKQKNGGGATKIERYSNSADATRANFAIVKEKTTPRTGKGQYLISSFPLHGFHVHNGKPPISTDSVIDTVRYHYADKETSEAITAYLSVDAMRVWIDEAIGIVDTTKDEAPVDRGGSWASW